MAVSPMGNEWSGGSEVDADLETGCREAFGGNSFDHPLRRLTDRRGSFKKKMLVLRYFVHSSTGA
jgi:hypothetical protein